MTGEGGLVTSQARALVLADQMDPLRANSEFLRGQWCRRTGLTPRPPAGGSGSVTLAAAVGSVFVGSTTIGDPAATFGISDAGLRFQVLYTVVVGVSGTATIEVVGVDTGPQTNLAAGALLRPANGPIGWTVPGSPLPETEWSRWWRHMRGSLSALGWRI